MQPSLNFLSYYRDQLHQNNSGQPKRLCNPHLRRKTTNSAKNWVQKSWFANAIACVLDNAFILHPLQPVSKQNICLLLIHKTITCKGTTENNNIWKKSPKFQLLFDNLTGGNRYWKYWKDFVVLTHMTATAAMSPGWVTTKRLVNGPWWGCDKLRKPAVDFTFFSKTVGVRSGRPFK